MNYKDTDLCDTYVYVDYRADDHIPFYVGIGNIKRCKKYSRNVHHTNVKNKHGMYRKIVQGPYNWKQACLVEIELIASFKNTPNGNKLTNITEGGEGCRGVTPTESQLNAASLNMSSYNERRATEGFDHISISNKDLIKSAKRRNSVSKASILRNNELMLNTITGEVLKNSQWYVKTFNGLKYSNFKHLLVPYTELSAET